MRSDERFNEEKSRVYPVGISDGATHKGTTIFLFCSLFFQMPFSLYYHYGNGIISNSANIKDQNTRVLLYACNYL